MYIIIVVSIYYNELGSEARLSSPGLVWSTSRCVVVSLSLYIYIHIQYIYIYI